MYYDINTTYILQDSNIRKNKKICKTKLYLSKIYSKSQTNENIKNKT